MDNVVACLWRGDVVESRIRAHIAVVDTSGRLLHYVGDPSYVTYLRSSSKPLQALPLLETGAADAFGLTEDEVAVACASHNGEDFHTDAVRSLLSKAGLTEDDLQCGAHPINRSFHRRALPDDQPPERIHSNCSGKHAGMLATSKYRGWPIATYRDPQHPLQRLNLKTLSDLSAYPADEIHIGVDGCGVPVFAMPIRNMALAFARLARSDALPAPRHQTLTRIRSAMMAHPHMIAGTHGFDSDLMREARGTIVCKGGAAALHCVGLPAHGIGIAIKIEDADAQYIPPTSMEVLRQLNALSADTLEALDAYRWRPPVTNANDDIVGRVETTVTLQHGAYPGGIRNTNP